MFKSNSPFADDSSLCINNSISIGYNADIPAEIRGLEVSATSTDTADVHHNSVYIYGSPTAGNNNSFAFIKLLAGSEINVSNNLFINNRSGGSGNHYSGIISLTSGIGTTGVKSSLDRNVYYTQNKNTMGATGNVFSPTSLNFNQWKSHFRFKNG